MLKNRLVALRFLLLDMQMASSVLAELKAAKKSTGRSVGGRKAAEVAEKFSKLFRSTDS